MQEKNKIITISILLICAIVLMFAFSNIKFNNNLNANNNDDDNENPKDNPFTYQNARSSGESDVLFENNFGGSQADEICQVYNLDYYYIIGHTKSQDYYFFNTKSGDTSCVYVIKMSRSGNVAGVSLSSQNNLIYTDSYVTSFGIYILAHNTENNSSVVNYYSFSTSGLTEVFSVNELKPLKIIKNNQLILAGSFKDKLVLYYFYEESKNYEVQETNITVTDIMLFTAYQNGYLVFANSNYDFSIFLVNSKNYSLLYSVAGLTLLDFTVNEFGFGLLLENVTQISYVCLKFNFEEQNKTTLANIGFSYTLLTHNNNVYIFYKTIKEKIHVMLFSAKGDLVFNVGLSVYAKNIIKGKTIGDNFVLMLTSNENNLYIVTINSLLHTVKENYLTFNANGTVLEIEENFDSHLMFFGTSEGNSVIKHNFGKSDIFVIKFANY